MITNIQILKKAREMRLSGFSLAEISKQLAVHKSTLSSWLKDIVLTDLQKEDLKKRVNARMSRGRLNASISVRSRRIYEENRIFEESKKEFKALTKDPMFMVGLTMYMTKGVKKGSSFQFASNDNNTINFMIIWVKKYLKIDDEMIKIRNYDKYNRMDISRISILRKVLSWQKLLVQYMIDK